MSIFRPIPQARRLAAALALAVAMLVLLVQTLGFVHRVVHLPHAAAGPALPLVTHSHAHFLNDLFAGHASDADCRVFDQLVDGDSACGVPAVVLPPVFSSQVFHFLLGEALARWSALFDARGPPLSSLR